MSRNPNPELVVGLTMDQEFGPFPDYESAVKWLELRRNFVKDSRVAQNLIRKEVSRRVKVELKKGSEMVCVRGFDNKLPDTDIKRAMANHFSSCGEIVDFRFAPFCAPKSHPNRFVTIYILGEDAKEKAEQLNGSDLGGCKLVVTVPGFETTVPERPIQAGYALPEDTRRQLTLIKERNKALHEEETRRCAEKKMRKLLMKQQEALRQEESKQNEAL